MVYYINGNKYMIKHYKLGYVIEEHKSYFDGKFYSDSGYRIYCDNMMEVREALTELNGGVDIW